MATPQQTRDLRSMAKIYDAEMQYLHVAIAKDIGINSRGGVEAFDSDAISRETAGLKPLLIYSLTAPCYGVKARQLVDAAAPIPITQFLAQAWSAAHRLGMPQRIEMEDGLLKSDRGFKEWARAQGVSCEPPLSVKALRAFSRSAQDLRWAITFAQPDWHPRGAPSIDAANGSLHYYDTFSMATYSGSNTSMVYDTFVSWCTRGQPFFTGSGIRDDWSPEFIAEKPKALPKPHLAVERDSGEEPLYVHGLKELVAMWPGGRRAFFGGLQTTARDFDHWVAGRAHLPSREIAAVLKKVGAIYDHRFDGYRLVGGNLLIAKTAKGVDLVYTEISNGGDLEFAFEILPPAGVDLLMRALVFAAWGGETTLVLFPRNVGNLEAPLDKHSLINLSSARRAPMDVFESLDWIIVQRELFDCPQKVGVVFGEQHRDWLAS